MLLDCFIHAIPYDAVLAPLHCLALLFIVHPRRCVNIKAVHAVATEDAATQSAVALAGKDTKHFTTAAAVLDIRVLLPTLLGH